MVGAAAEQHQGSSQSIREEDCSVVQQQISNLADLQEIEERALELFLTTLCDVTLSLAFTLAYPAADRMTH
jgi:dynactin complex subunit